MMTNHCCDCGAAMLPVSADQLNQPCLLCQFGIPPHPKAWLTTVRSGDRTVAIQHARAYWRELGQRAVASSSSIDGLSEFERQFWAVGCLSDAVIQGGFEQFFHHHSYATYVEALRGLDSMGAFNGFALLSKAKSISTAGADLPDDVNARRDLLAKNWDQSLQQRLNALSRQFCLDSDELEVLWFEFGIQHGLFQPLRSE